jgi:hypothetical protein
MSKIETKTYTCSKCGWTLKTPFGEDDIAEHSKLHIQKYHSTPAADEKTMRLIRRLK